MSKPQIKAKLAKKSKLTFAKITILLLLISLVLFAAF